MALQLSGDALRRVRPAGHPIRHKLCFGPRCNRASGVACVSAPTSGGTLRLLHHATLHAAHEWRRQTLSANRLASFTASAFVVFVYVLVFCHGHELRQTRTLARPSSHSQHKTRRRRRTCGISRLTIKRCFVSRTLRGTPRASRAE